MTTGRKPPNIGTPNPLVAPSGAVQNSSFSLQSQNGSSPKDDFELEIRLMPFDFDSPTANPPKETFPPCRFTSFDSLYRWSQVKWLPND
jgi:hypothetical protein